MTDHVMSIDIAMATSASKACNGTTYDKLVAAMKGARENTMASYGREHALLNAGVAGVVSDIGIESPDGSRLAAECRNLNKLNAWMSAMNSGVAGEMPEMEEVEPIGIMQAWREVSA